MEEYNLDISTNEKPIMNIDGVFLVLRHHWDRDASAFGTRNSSSNLHSSLIYEHIQR